MRSLSLWSSIVPLAALLDVSLAIHIDLPSRSTERLPNLFARDDVNATSSLDYVGAGYFINITLGGEPFSVLIDTGRWVVFNSFPFLPSPSARTHHTHSLLIVPTLAPTFGSRGQCQVPLTRVLLPRSRTLWAQLEVCVLSVLPRPKSAVDAFMRVLRVYTGPVKTAALNILGYTIPDQAYSAPPSISLTFRIR